MAQWLKTLSLPGFKTQCTTQQGELMFLAPASAHLPVIASVSSHAAL